MVNTVSFRSLILRSLGLLLIWGLLNVTIWYWGDHLASALIPLYKISFSFFDHHYDLQTLRLESQREPYFKIAVKTAGSRVLNNMLVPNGVKITSQTLQGHAFQLGIIAFGLLLIWPVRCAWHRTVILLVSMPVIIFMLSLDVPLVLIGSLEDLILVNFDPKAVKYSIYVHVMHFLNGGGRLLLGIVAAALSVILSYGFIGLFQKARHKNFIK